MQPFWECNSKNNSPLNGSTTNKGKNSLVSLSQVGKWRSRTGMNHGQLIQTSISGLMEPKNPYQVKTCQGSANVSQIYI